MLRIVEIRLMKNISLFCFCLIYYGVVSQNQIGLNDSFEAQLIRKYGCLAHVFHNTDYALIKRNDTLYDIINKTEVNSILILSVINDKKESNIIRVIKEICSSPFESHKNYTNLLLKLIKLIYGILQIN